jgi:hypothetical protein
MPPFPLLHTRISTATFLQHQIMTTLKEILALEQVDQNRK